MTPPTEVAAAVIYEDGRYLIALRYPHSHCGRLWEFPGGKRLPGETLESCLIREIREELGVGIAVGELIETITHHYPEIDLVLHFFTCRRVSGKPQPLGCAELRWVTREQLPMYSFPEADTKLIKKLAGTHG